MRFDDRVTGNLATRTVAKVIHFEIDPAEVDKNKNYGSSFGRLKRVFNFTSFNESNSHEAWHMNLKRNMK
jgi:acetolactate synthase-1/2/3 large subunit